MCLNYFWERACSVMFVSVTCQECGEGAPCLGLAWGRKISETGHLRDAASDLIVCYRKCWGHMLLLAGVCESWYAFCDGLECVCGYVLWWAWCVCVLICFYDGLGVCVCWLFQSRHSGGLLSRAPCAVCTAVVEGGVGGPRGKYWADLGDGVLIIYNLSKHLKWLFL